MEISAQKVLDWKAANKEYLLLDVRRDDEREKASLGGIHIPLNELETRFTEIPHNKRTVVVYCHHGVRSIYATQFLKMHGYDALSLRGGIDEWSKTIDPSIPLY